MCALKSFSGKKTKTIWMLFKIEQKEMDVLPEEIKMLQENTKVMQLWIKSNPKKSEDYGGWR